MTNEPINLLGTSFNEMRNKFKAKEVMWHNPRSNYFQVSFANIFGVRKLLIQSVTITPIEEGMSDKKLVVNICLFFYSEH